MANPSLIVKRSYDIKEAEAIVVDPTIWEAISGTYVNTTTPKLVDKRSHIYLIGYVDSVPIGLFIIHPRLNKDYYCHVQVLPEHRVKYSTRFGKSVIQWTWDNTLIDTLYATISPNFPNVLSFAIAMGFSKTKFISGNKKSILTNSPKWELQIQRGL